MGHYEKLQCKGLDSAGFRCNKPARPFHRLGLCCEHQARWESEVDMNSSEVPVTETEHEEFNNYRQFHTYKFSCGCEFTESNFRDSVEVWAVTCDWHAADIAIRATELAGVDSDLGYPID